MPRDYKPSDYDASSVKLDRFIKAATDQVGDKYQFGAEADENDPNPSAFDSSELVEWASHQAGFHDMPDGSWNQYRYLHEQGASVTLDEAMHTRGALVFGFSSDPLESTDRPARAYVGISLGDGKQIIDVSERSGEVRVMEPGGFYSYGAKIPEFHAPDDSVTPDDPFAPSQDPAKSYGPDGQIIHEDLPAPSDPVLIPGAGPSQPPADAPAPSDPAKSYGPDGRIIHEDLPAPSDAQDPQVSYPDPEDPQVCYPDDDEPQVSTPDNPEDQVCYPDDDDSGPTSMNESGFDQGANVAYAGDASTYGDTPGYGSDAYAYDDGSTSSDSYSGDSYSGDSYDGSSDMSTSDA